MDPCKGIKAALEEEDKKRVCMWTYGQDVLARIGGESGWNVSIGEAVTISAHSGWTLTIDCHGRVFMNCNKTMQMEPHTAAIFAEELKAASVFSTAMMNREESNGH